MLALLEAKNFLTTTRLSFFFRRGGFMGEHEGLSNPIVSIPVFVFCLGGLRAVEAQSLKEIRIDTSDVTSTNFNLLSQGSQTL